MPPEENPDVGEGVEGEGSKLENQGISGWLSGWGVSKITGAVQEKVSGKLYSFSKLASCKISIWELDFISFLYCHSKKKVFLCFLYMS